MVKAFKAHKSKHPNATKADIKQWVESAINLNTGFAFWESPPTRNVCLNYATFVFHLLKRQLGSGGPW